jgi:phage terminase large subunit GpA-like protein
LGVLGSPERLFREARASAWAPPPAIDYLAFAERHIVFGAGEPRPGPYDRRSFGYFDAILQALSPGDPCRIVTLQASAQIGKTILGCAFVLGSVTLGRGTAMIVHPSIDNAERWSRMKLGPLMRATPIVNDVFPPRARDTSDSVKFKERVDGLSSLLISGANSASSLSQVSAQYLLEDDLSKWEANAAGDSEAQADSRAMAFEHAKVFKTSTPLTRDNCRITRNYEAGSQERGHVPCPACGCMHELLWANFHFGDLRRPYFNCPDCGAIIEEKHRQGMLDGFQWVAANPAAARTHRSFRLWAAYSILVSWQRIAAQWHRAQGDSAAEQVFCTDVRGEAYEIPGTGRPPGELAARAARSHYARGQVPQGALVLVLAIDVQGDRCEWACVGFGEHNRKFVIDIGTAPGHISEPDAKRNLDLLVRQRWMNFRGRAVELSMTVIDANYATTDVLEWCRRHPQNKVIAIRGVPGDGKPRLQKQRELDEKRGTLLRYRRQFYNCGTYDIKAALYRDLGRDDPNAKGHVSFPNNLPDRYFAELVSEKRVGHKTRRGTVFTWDKADGVANEQHDCFIYAIAGSYQAGVHKISDEGWAERRATLEAPLATVGPSGMVRSVPRPSLASQLAGGSKRKEAKPPDWANSWSIR